MSSLSSRIARALRSLPIRTAPTALPPLTTLERVCLGLPLVGMVLAIYFLGVPVLWRDEWDGVGGTVLYVHQHGLSPGVLWGPQNEHRIPLPKLLFLLDSHIDLNPMRFMFLSQVCLTLFFLLLLPALRQAAALLPERWRAGFYFLSSALFYSFVQHENIFWGFQIAWAIEALCIGLVITGLLERRFWRAAIGFALAYLSSAHFLVLIPIILLIEALHLRGEGPHPGRISWRAWGRYLALVLVLGLALAGYLTDLPRPPHHPSRLYALLHPLETLLYFLIQIGSPLCCLLGTEPYYVMAPLMGALHLAGFVMLLRHRRHEQLGLEFWLIVAMYGNTLLILMGRVGFGVGWAISSRYTVLSVFGWLAWLVALLKSYPEAHRVRQFVLGLLLIGLVPSVRQLHNYAVYQAPPRRAGRACLAEVLAAPDPRAAAATRKPCLLRLYPVIDRLLDIATGLEAYQPVLSSGGSP